MNEEAQKPKRNYRRWIIAVVLLSVVVVAGWRHWQQRLDQRFVGTWRTPIGTAFGTEIFYPDGRRVYRAPGGTEYHGRWWVRGETLVIRHGDLSLEDFIPRLLGAHDNVQKILSVSAEEFQLQRRWDGEIFTHYRIPD